MFSAVPLKPSASRHVFPQHLRHAEEAHSTFAKEETQDETTLQVRDGAHRCTVCTIHLLKVHLEDLAHRSDVDGILQVSVLIDSHRFTKNETKKQRKERMLNNAEYMLHSWCRTS
jgi:hypothetical protein